MNQKGQESAPFELLVAVIIMGFVMFVGMYAMANLQREQCDNETLKIIQDFSRTLEEVATTPGHIKTYNLAFPSGCGSDDVSIRLQTWSKPESCSIYCESSGSLCILIHYVQSNVRSITKCVNIPPDTLFPDTASLRGCNSKMDETPAYRLINVKVDIPEGYYLFQNKSSPDSTNPVICAYLRT